MPDIKIIHGDCMDYLPKMKDNEFSLAIVDPPYGIGIETSGTHFKKYTSKGWDSNTPPQGYFDELFRVSENQIIWGGNYFLDYLGKTKCFFNMGQNDREGYEFLRMQNSHGLHFNKPTRIKKLCANQKDRIHPTQKPVALYKWLLTKYAKPGQTILDTHLGSGSSAIACHDYGYDLTAYEIDKEYFEAATERIERHKGARATISGWGSYDR